MSDNGYRILQSCAAAAILTAVTGTFLHFSFGEVMACFAVWTAIAYLAIGLTFAPPTRSSRLRSLTDIGEL
jgi:hypothetical protein